LHELAAMKDQQAFQVVASVMDVGRAENLGDRKDRTPCRTDSIADIDRAL
jgi:hypothetical protein